ncbi:MAG: hypothetical protein ACXWHB_06640 [Usitatibacter sp.]
MADPDKLKNDVVSYITSFSPSRDRVFTVRDFNSQVMARSFDASARDGLAAVLDELVASGVLDRRTPTDYALTEKGIGFVRDARAAKSDA